MIDIKSGPGNEPTRPLYCNDPDCEGLCQARANRERLREIAWHYLGGEDRYLVLAAADALERPPRVR